MSGATLNFKAVLFYGVLAGALIIALLYFFKVQPIYSLIQPAVAWATGLIKVDTTQGIGKLITSNLPTIIGVGAMAVPLIYTTVRSRLEVAAKTKALQAAEELSLLETQESKATLANVKAQDSKTILELQAKLNSYETDPALNSLQTSYSSLQTEYQKSRAQMDLLSQQLESEIQKRPVITKTVVK